MISHNNTVNLTSTFLACVGLPEERLNVLLLFLGSLLFCSF